MINPYFRIWQKMGNLDSELVLSLRKDLIWAYSWAVPSDEAIEEIIRHGPLVEVGAGTGYWSWLCAQAGADVIAYDREEFAVPRWFPVQAGGPESLSPHSERTLVLCWPPYQESMAADCLRGFSGRRCVYIGEWRGRTADDEFHTLLESDFRRVTEIEIPVWPGFRDRLHVFER